jgi:hypothetical protein
MEQKTVIIPAARQVYNVHNQGTSLPWGLVAPKGKVLQQIWIQGRINLAGAVVAARFHKAIKAIKVNGPNGQVLTAITDAIPNLCLASHALKEDNFYEVAPRNTDIVRNPSVAAVATNYDAIFKIHAPLPGDQFTVSIELNDMISAFGAGVTGATTDWTIIAVWTSPEPAARQYMILADWNSASTVSKKYQNVSKCALFAAAEFTTFTTAVKLGKDLTNPQIQQNEDVSNDNLRGLSADGVSTATRTLPVLDPATAADEFALIERLDVPGEVVLQASTGTAFSAILFTRGTVEAIQTDQVK